MATAAAERYTARSITDRERQRAGATLGDVLAAKLRAVQPSPSPAREAPAPRQATSPVVKVAPSPPPVARDHGDQMLADHEGDVYPPPIGREVTFEDGVAMRGRRPWRVLTLDVAGAREAAREVAIARANTYHAPPPPPAKISPGRAALIASGAIVPEGDCVLTPWKKRILAEPSSRKER